MLMKKILAVSGGVDSCVMLHMFKGEDIVVAHFNHRMRDNSDEDEEFVRRIAGEYNAPFISGRSTEKLQSEADARAARYDFLRQVAKEYGGKIYTAHHLDDLVETIMINILRGTGWRGLAVFGATKIERPLVGMTKRDIWRYAGENELRFREDQSNNSDEFLRNRVREKLRSVDDDTRKKIYKKWLKQVELRNEIDMIVDEMIEKITVDGGVLRKELQKLPMEVGIEVVRKTLLGRGKSATRPQLEKIVGAIGAFGNGKKMSLGRDYFIEFGRELVKF